MNLSKSARKICAYANINRITFACLLTFNLSIFTAQAQPIPSKASMDAAFQDSLELLFRNLTYEGVSTGGVIASPSTSAPNYFYHWTRDAALVHESLLKVYNYTQDEALKNRIYTLAKDWISFEEIAQRNSLTAVAGLGEPRYLVNGNVETSDWGRPQSDGPAARAVTMSLWAMKLLDKGEAQYVQDRLYSAGVTDQNADPSAETLIKRDLAYLLSNWKTPSFDIWEETVAMHFYTLSMQRRAFQLGSQLASRMQDWSAAAVYSSEANAIKEELLRFFNAGKPYVVVSLDQNGGWTNKLQNLDSAVIIAANHSLLVDKMDDDLLVSKKFMLQNTQAVLESTFHNLYDINKNDPFTATAIGRYPEDVYDGSGFSGANPWFLTTHASAEFYCKIAKLEPSQLTATGIKNKGLSFFGRTLKHREQSRGEMSEQFSRFNGFLVGARHLTWSYASYLSAYLACQ